MVLVFAPMVQQTSWWELQEVTSLRSARKQEKKRSELQSPLKNRFQNLNKISHEAVPLNGSNMF